jgi:hypothetical protein
LAAFSFFTFTFKKITDSQDDILFLPPSGTTVVQTLSAYLNKPAATAPPEPDFPAWNEAALKTDTFRFLNFLFQFCPSVPQDAAIRAWFAKIGIGPGKPFDVTALPAERKEALAAAMKDGFKKIGKEVASLGRSVNGWRIIYAGAGDRAAYNGNWLMRASRTPASTPTPRPRPCIPLTRSDRE